MAKYFTIIALLGLSLALVGAEAPRYRTSRRNGAIRTNVRFLARQEQAPDALPSPAPYPPAGVTPAVPFDLPTETEAPVAQPDETYGPPDSTYGPPPEATYGPPDSTYGPPPATETAADDEEDDQQVDEEAVPLPDETYGPPADDQQPAIVEEPAAEEIAPAVEGDLVAQNLIQPRNKAVRSRARPARLRVAPARARLVEIIRSEPVLVYTLQ